LRVVFLSWQDLSNPLAGGSEVVVDRLAGGLADRGHEVALLCGGPIAERDYEVVAAGGKFSQYLRAPLAFWRRFRKVDVVVDVENGVPFFAPLWQRRPVVCLVHHVHTHQWDLYFSPAAAWAGRFLETRGMPSVYRRQRFVAVSASTASHLVDLGIDRDRVRIVEMGCDPVPTPSPKAREPRFVTVGRLVPNKRVDLLLDLWKRVQPEVGGTLMIAGDGPELEPLQRRGIPDAEFLGRVSEAEKRRLLSEAWVFLQTSVREGWGTAVMEAAASGTPTLAFDVPGLRDSVVHGSSGLLAQNDEEFIDYWIDLADDSAKRAQLASGARARAATFTWERAIKGFEAVLHEAVEAQQDPLQETSTAPELEPLNVLDV
jgi:glycosyltransferase involved in cell wall biosynthesis